MRVFAPTTAKSEGIREMFAEDPVLMVSSNGGGLGHLTRLWAIERRLEEEVITYTLSSAYDKLGKPTSRMIYFPSYGTLGMYGRAWNVLLALHFNAVVKALRPKRIVFDGTTVYPGIIAVSQKYGIPITWIQRGCWKPEADARSKQRRRADHFADQVIIPGDYGCDEQVSVGLEPVRVPPIVLTEEADLYPREVARMKLGLPADKKLMLIQLGGSAIGNLNSLLDIALDEVTKLGSDWLPVVVKNPLASVDPRRGCATISAYPLAMYYRAFDAALAPAGYNTAQEAVQFCLPTILLPNPATITDDQGRRARTLAHLGIALCAESENQLREAFHQIGKEDIRAEIRAAAEEARVFGGADAAARAIRALL